MRLDSKLEFIMQVDIANYITASDAPVMILTSTYMRIQFKHLDCDNIKIIVF